MDVSSTASQPALTAVETAGDRDQVALVQLLDALVAFPHSTAHAIRGYEIENVELLVRLWASTRAVRLTETEHRDGRELTVLRGFTAIANIELVRPVVAS